MLLHSNLLKLNTRNVITGAASSPSLSIWQGKKEMGKEGLLVGKELKRLQSNPVRFEWFMKTHVSRLLKSDLVAVLAEFQRQNLVPLSMKVTLYVLYVQSEYIVGALMVLIKMVVSLFSL
ncbi:UNVERIFIED_CONTAM: Pentatricopeptide repeat-containing protein [Sesamum radiatum]|uniref:Pentatricopeptide repeat-containing protein n=1 Tax=Sesamum radiatum TaxID=300843 RepID=A0AAW2QH90_SESRA